MNIKETAEVRNTATRSAWRRVDPRILQCALEGIRLGFCASEIAEKQGGGGGGGGGGVETDRHRVGRPECKSPETEVHFRSFPTDIASA